MPGRTIGRVLYALGTLLLAACSRPVTLESIQGFAQGTTYHIQYWSGTPTDRAQIAQAITAELARIDAGMSGYRDDSTIERFNRAQSTEPQAVGPEIALLVREAAAITAASDGCYDLTVKPLFDLWGFSGEQLTLPDAAALRDASRAVGMDKLALTDNGDLRKRNPGVQVDLSSIAQGYTVARMAELLENAGVRDYLVEIGGEMQVQGAKPDGAPWRIAVERPAPDQRQVTKIITLEQGQRVAIVTSGTYRHYYDDQGVRYSHILDARTARPVTHQTVSVTVLYPDAALADGWSTALLCLGREEGLAVANRHGVAALFIEQSGDELTETASAALSALQGIRIE